MVTVTTGRSALATVDMIVSRGADQEYLFNYSTADEEDVITPVDLTGWTAAAQLRYEPGGIVYLTLTTENAGITLDYEGNVTVTITHEDTEDDEWDRYLTGVWDLELTDTSGEVTRFVEGSVTISQDVTRDE